MYKYLWTLKNRHIKGRHSSILKNRYKNKRFEIMEHLINCLHTLVNLMSKNVVK